MSRLLINRRVSAEPFNQSLRLFEEEHAVEIIRAPFEKLLEILVGMNGDLRDTVKIETAWHRLRRRVIDLETNVGSRVDVHQTQHG